MGELTLLEKIEDWFKYSLPQFFCAHKEFQLNTEVDELMSVTAVYLAICKKCDKSIYIEIPEKEKTNSLNDNQD